MKAAQNRLVGRYLPVSVQSAVVPETDRGFADQENSEASVEMYRDGFTPCTTECSPAPAWRLLLMRENTHADLGAGRPLLPVSTACRKVALWWIKTGKRIGVLRIQNVSQARTPERLSWRTAVSAVARTEPCEIPKTRCDIPGSPGEVPTFGWPTKTRSVHRDFPGETWLRSETAGQAKPSEWIY